MKLGQPLFKLGIFCSSIAIYPWLLSLKYPAIWDRNVTLTLIMIFLLGFYNEIIAPLHPNKYFNLIYTLLAMLVLIFLKTKMINYHLVILLICQLGLIFLAKNRPFTPIIQQLIIPVFTTLPLIYTIFHFLSYKFVMMILAINTVILSLILVKRIILGVFCPTLILGALFLLEYVSFNNLLISIFLIMIIRITQHYKPNIFQQSAWFNFIRILLSLALLL
ncbi:hypothetical protein HU830_06785 [Lactobacillus sp. DCY120]|uniref:Uncharacterized protein n=1 Tax=Bombilactobacillus apium TaxID=2675299 RepID=A0A850R8J5_9LACO|nr:hypothetical protein [Bombilactobacillus apium]NVY96855.1 hypothetical protein [Bombilactobacillus apium]